MDRTLRLLIVEDSADDVAFLLRAVRGGGFMLTYAVVETAPGMRTALERQDWDVITSDHSMPQFSAPAAVALAMELRPNIPLIIVSGEINLNLAVSLMREGAWDYVQKRELARLVPAIERALREVRVHAGRRKAEHALEVSETRYRRLFETAQDGILILDAQTGQIDDVNPFLIDMLGYSKAQFLGRKLWEVGAFKDVEASKAAFLELQKQSYIRYEDLPLQACDGRVIATEFVSNVYRVDNKNVIQCNIRDITERKKAERELREHTILLEEKVQRRTTQLATMVEELESFNYSVSHDLRAPLRHIDGFADHLQEGLVGALDSGAARLIQRIHASVKGMNALIDALLELARISHHDIRLEATDLSALARDVAAEMQSNEPFRALEFVIAQGLSAQCDARLLRVVLENLMSNAWKFTARRSAARIEFGLASQTDGSRAYFVRDNGAGFDMAQGARLFTAFVRLHSNQDFPGTGIGLATVQRIIRRHNGRVWAQGATEQGATFYFTL